MTISEQIAELRKEGAAVSKRMDEILDAADKDKAGSLTAAQDAEYSELSDTFDDIYGTLADGKRSGGQIAQLRQQQDRQARNEFLGQPAGRIVPPGQPGPQFGDRPALGDDQPRGEVFHTPDGQQIRAYVAGEDMTRTWQRQDGLETVSLAEMAQGMISGNWDHMPGHARMDMASGLDASGGHMVPESTAIRFFDNLRSATVLGRAGAMSVSMQQPELHLVRFASDPVAQWVPEGGAVQASSATTERVTLRPRKVAVLVPITEELAQDGANTIGQLSRMMEQAAALAIDQAGLYGDGTNGSPTGIRHTTGINTAAAVGAIGDYSQDTAAIQTILDANYGGDVSGLAYVMAPRTGAQYDGLTDTTNQPLMPTPWASQLQRLYTTSIAVNEGVGNDESFGIMGDYRQVILGYRPTGMSLQAFTSGEAADAAGTTYNAITKFYRLLRLHIRMDVGVIRPQHFVELPGISA